MEEAIPWRVADSRVVDIHRYGVAPEADDRKRRRKAETAPGTSERRRKKVDSEMALADGSNCVATEHSIISINSSLLLLSGFTRERYKTNQRADNNASDML